MTPPTLTKQPIQDFPLWEIMKEKNACMSFTLELTARCNNNCQHCYINLASGDASARMNEIRIDKIFEIADHAVELGAIWCNITGGEPLIRPDFSDIYRGLKERGLLISIMTNATLITEEHVKLFQEFPPRDIEVTVYGVTRETYESVSRRQGSFDAFIRGLNMLKKANVLVRLKATIIRSNFHEIQKISEFCRSYTKDYYRFDPILNLRLDHNLERNEEIRKQRLSPEEIVILEQSNADYALAFEESCNDSKLSQHQEFGDNRLFHCNIGRGNFIVSPDGRLRLCTDLCNSDCVYDLKTGSLADAWQNFIPKVQNMSSDSENYLNNCAVCPLLNLCFWCPARADLETGRLDEMVDYYCQIAHARAKALGFPKEK